MNYLKIVYSGIIATAAMTTIMLLIPLLGLPRLNFSTLLITITNKHLALGWLMHFAIGIVFAFVYVVLFNNLLPVISNIGRGAIYSIIMFVVSAAAMWLIGALQNDFAVKETMALSLFANVLAYIVYGIVLGAFHKRSSPVLFPEHQHGPHPAE